MMRVISKIVWKYFVGMMSRRMQEIASVFQFLLFLLDDEQGLSMSTVVMMIVTPIVGGMYYHTGDFVSKMAMVLNSLGCLGYVMYTISKIKKTFEEFENLPHNSTSRPRPKVKMKRKKQKYKIKGHRYKSK